MGHISLLFQKNKYDKWKAFSLTSKQIWLTEALWFPCTKEGEEWAAEFSVAVPTEVMKPCPVSVILCCTVPFRILQASPLVFPQTSHSFTSYIWVVLSSCTVWWTLNTKTRLGEITWAAYFCFHLLLSGTQIHLTVENKGIFYGEDPRAGSSLCL